MYGLNLALVKTLACGELTYQPVKHDRGFPSGFDCTLRRESQAESGTNAIPSECTSLREVFIENPRSILTE